VTVLWLFIALMMPFVVLMYWSNQLVASEVFTDYVEKGIPLLALMCWMLILGFTDWFGHKWYMTNFTKFMLGGAFAVLLMFCFTVIFGVDGFTYNGSSALLLILNFLFTVPLTLLKKGTSL